MLKNITLHKILLEIWWDAIKGEVFFFVSLTLETLPKMFLVKCRRFA